jgi:hypothetical protein
MAEHPETEMAELQDPESWDWDNAQRYPPNPNAGAVIRVRLAGQDFRAVAQAARAAGMTLAAYIREAAVARATGATPDGDRSSTGTEHPRAP